MKKFHRVCSALAALTVMISSLSAVTLHAYAEAQFQPDEKGLVWMEPELLADKSGFVTVDHPDASGEKVLSYGGGAEAPYVLSFDFAVGQTQNYDIWLLGTDPTLGYASQPTFRLDNGGVVKPGGFSSGKVYEMNIQIPFDVAWSKAISGQSITAGEVHNLQYTLPFRGETDLTIFGAVDAVAIVPSAWDWAPDASTAKPTGPKVQFQPDENGVIWMEPELLADKSGFVTVDHPDASGEKVLSYGGGAGAPYVLSFNFEVGQAQDYDIWLLGTDPTLGYASQPTFRLDNGEAVKPGGFSSGKVYEMNIQIPFDVAWSKAISGQSVTAGKVHNLQYTLPLRSETDPTIFGAIDAVAIVPSSWKWTPGASTEKPTGPAQKVFVQAEDGVVWMEAEKAAFDEGYTVAANPLASDGSALVCDMRESQVEGDTPYSVDFSFELNTPGAYDVWAVTTAPNQGWLSNYEVSVDGGTPATVLPGQCGFDFARDENGLYNLFYGNSPINNYWVKLGNGMDFTQGSHTIAYLSPCRSDGWHLSSIDCVVVMPASWNWTPQIDSVQRPLRLNNAFAFIELEKTAAPADGFVCETTGNALYTEIMKSASGKGMLYAESGDGTNDAYLSYDFALESAGAYDVWYLGGPVDAEFLSKMFWNVDAAADTDYAPAVRDGDFYLEYVSGGVNAGWQKIASHKEIQAGSHSLDLKFTARSDALHFTRSDAIVVVPSGWEWLPEEEVFWARTNATLDAFQAYYHYADQYPEGVDSDIGFDPAKIGCAGSALSYVSATPDLISDTGAVSRPEDGDQWGIVNITAENWGTVSDEFQWMVKVLAAGKYDITDFKMTYADGTPVGNTLVSGSAVKASCGAKLHNAGDTGEIAAVIALYDAEGRLAGLALQKTAASTDSQTIAVSLTLPENDLTGYTLKAFLWDGLANAVPVKKAIAN